MITAEEATQLALNNYTSQLNEIEKLIRQTAEKGLLEVKVPKQLIDANHILITSYLQSLNYRVSRPLSDCYKIYFLPYS